ncbi:MAG: iron-containing alcohol dehydrogenase [Rickettsiales bacterium]|jgi:glycerol-1-phosphate dehydrogenase [NAD(P)+]
MFDKKTNEQLISLMPNSPIIIGEESLRHDIDDLVLLALPAMRFGIVADVNTDLAFGDKIFNALKGNFDCTHVTLADSVDADDKAVNYIRKKTIKCDALIAVGGGTINDLCKYAAHLDGKPYIIFPTSASMNGYLSANASITVKGHKTTLPAQLPKAVFCDFSVIASAPIRLGKSGLGDSLARPTAQADWLLSNLLLNTAYDERPFALLTDIEPDLFDNAGGIAKNDPHTIKILMKLLLLSGIGMTLAGGSYPASQGEHMIAHSYNMLKKPSPIFKKILHGEEIAITSLYMAKRQENLLNIMPKLYSKKFEENLIEELFGDSLMSEFKSSYAKKQDLINKHHHNLNKNNWDNIRSKIEKVIIKSQQLENILKQSESSIIPEAIGWNDINFKIACNIARFTRDRFTFLDLEQAN